MKQWYIESGELRAAVEAETAEDALIEAIKQKRPRLLGRLARASNGGFSDDDPSDDDHVWWQKIDVDKINALLKFDDEEQVIN